ncbi:MAG TPA: hypothetical protein VLU54_04605 [Casimicrobiaceae bacterium]|nr:hypothetical protein [Casimicrobiaceae bacterium]
MPHARDLGLPGRVPLLMLGFASLFAGIGAGLARLGWPLPGAGLAYVHGPLMASGFFGTVISLERAVALRRRWAYAAPLLSGTATLASLLAAPALLAPALATLGSAVMVAASAAVYSRQRELFTLTLALGALAWSAGNLLWLAGAPVAAAAPWWIGFLVLTIAGERLELSRFLPPSPAARRVFALLLVAQVTALTLSLFAYALGTTLLGLALAGLAAWLMRQDIARRTIHSRGLTRYIAACLLSGYIWLAVAGVSMVAAGGLGTGGAAYDATLHAVLLGFVFSMVFGHAPIIIPSVIRVAIPYSRWFYAPLALLHASLLLRLVGDWIAAAQWRAWGGMLNAVALCAFVLGTLIAMLRGIRDRGRQAPPHAPPRHATKDAR